MGCCKKTNEWMAKPEYFSLYNELNIYKRKSPIHKLWVFCLFTLVIELMVLCGIFLMSQDNPVQGIKIAALSFFLWVVVAVGMSFLMQSKIDDDIEQQQKIVDSFIKRKKIKTKEGKNMAYIAWARWGLCH